MNCQLITLIKEICAEEGIAFSAFADDFILLLQKNGRKMYIYGNKFPNNSASSELICDDKAGLSEILAANGIPCVKHILFGSPLARWYASDEQKDRAELLRLLKSSPEGLVVKDNRGTGGVSVFRVKTEGELLNAAQKVFAVSDSLAVSGFESIKHEYRVLMLGSQFRYAFEKIRPEVTGDGKSTANGLIINAYGEKYVFPGERGEYIPAKGEKYLPEWRHNLGQGAKPRLVTDKTLIDSLSALAGKCMSALSLGFASVDIIDANDGLKVLEINSGVMIDGFSAFSDEYRELAKNAVKEAVISVIGKI